MREIKFRAWNNERKIMYNEGWYDDLYLGDDIYDKYLMQYTGLKDKNSVEIYEGDIVRKYEYIRFVEFKRGAFVLSGDVLLLSHFGETLEVIGNIYENPELLEAK